MIETTPQALLAAGALAPLDIHLARTLTRLAGEDADTALLLGIAAASRVVRGGHVCADLRALGGAPVTDDEGEPVGTFHWPALDAWRAALTASAVVGGPTDDTPLVLDAADRLYLRRYFSWQQALAAMLRRRALAPADTPDGPLLEAGLDRLFDGPPPNQGIDRQRVAALLAVLRRFTVVSGGPGTGKTSTVVKILALLVEQALARGEAPPTILLVAPTGKAAARLRESIQGAKARLDVTDAVRDAIPEDTLTIHRALGVIGGRTTRFRHHQDRPLAADVVLVDEASMVDLALMTRLVSAVPARARLVLLGDKDQLASVEAGAVLGDVCNAGAPWSWSRALADQVAALTGDAIPTDAASPADPAFGDALAQLTFSWRFKDDSGIADLAKAVNAGDAETAKAVLANPARPDVTLREPSTDGLPAELRADLVAAFRAVVDADTPKAKLVAFDRFRILAAHRRGAAGVSGLNQAAEQALSQVGLLKPRTEWYAHRPVMVVQNDYQVELFNGDVGMILDIDGELRAAFLSSSGEVRTVTPARLPAHETVFAMTVHKSQGSEFAAVALVLPTRVSPVLTRELVYTGITRAKERVVVYAPEDVLDESVQRRVARASGLRDALWGADGGG